MIKSKFLVLLLIIIASSLVLASFLIIRMNPNLTSPSQDVCSPFCLESCNGTMNTVDYFSLGEELYVKGSGLETNSRYKVYVVEDYTLWVRGTTTLADLNVVVGPINISTDATGHIVDQPVLIWASADLGYYDIFADCETAGTIGTYDAYDDMDDLDVDDAGFFVVPQIPLGTITGLLACFAAIMAKRRKIF